MSQQLLGFIDKRPLIWLHWLILTMFIFIYVTLISDVNIDFGKYTLFIGVLSLYLFIVISDSLIHKILGVD